MPKIEIKEHQNIEFKRSWQDNNLKVIASFANSEGGNVYIGVADNREVIGLESPEVLMEKIPNKIHDILGLILDVNLKQKDGKEYIDIEIQKSSVPISFRGKYYKRSGSTKRELHGNELNRFILSFSDTNWDTFIEDRATFDELDLATINKFRKISKNRLSFSEGVESDKELLEKLVLIINENLTRSAILLFGNNPQKFYVASFLKIGKFNAEGELIAQDIISGNLFNQIKQAEEILKTKYLIFNISFEGMQRIETLEYPIAALREIIVNALIHKDYMGTSIQMKIYPDKLVLWNEGKLPENITVEKLFKTHPSQPRNELLAKVFFFAEYIDAWGRGINKIIEACQKANLPLPEINDNFGGLQVTLFKDIYNETYLKNLGLNNRQMKGIQHLKKNGSITNRDYRKLVRVKERTALSDLNKLMKLEIIDKMGKTGRGIYYFLKTRNKPAKPEINPQKSHNI